MDFIEVERRGPAGIIWFTNAPEGVIGTRAGEEMLKAFRELSADESVVAIILTGGQPGMFIKHYDAGELFAIFDALEQGKELPDLGGKPGEAFKALIHEIEDSPKPVIAAINGTCMGGGFEVALACDIRIADPKADSIGLPETRVGTFPAGGGPTRLVRMIGEAKTLNMVLRGLVFTGQEAFDQGLVSELADDPVAKAVEIAAVWETRFRDGIPHVKRIIRCANDRTLAEGMEDEERCHGEVLQSKAVRDNLKRVLPPGDIRDL